MIRFYRKIAFPPDRSYCWRWMAFRNPKGGYGRFSFRGKLWIAHRFSYEVFCGPIPEGLTLDHLCRRTSCVNPFHLEPVTNAENIRRGTQGWNMSIKTHCPRGHEYDLLNTYWSKRGSRHCRACAREKARERRSHGG